MTEAGTQRVELVMDPFEYELAQYRFLRTINRATMQGLDRTTFVEFHAGPFAHVAEVSNEAIRLIVHHQHLLENKRYITPEVTERAFEFINRPGMKRAAARLERPTKLGEVPQGA